MTIQVTHKQKTGGCGSQTKVQTFTSPGYQVLNIICSGCRTRFNFPINIEYVSDQTIHVFGDETSFKDITAYGFVAVHSHNLKNLESALANLKLSYGLPSFAEFHSRIVFHGDQRKKSLWKNRGLKEIYTFARDAIVSLKLHKASLILCAVNRNEYPVEFPAGGGLPAGMMETKQLAGILFQGGMAYLVGNLGIDNIKLWVDHDKTKIDWFGKKIQSDKNYHFRDETSQKTIYPEKIIGLKSSILEMADLFVYVAVHALSAEIVRDQSKFSELYKLCNPILSALTYDPVARSKNQLVDSILITNHNKILSAK